MTSNKPIISPRDNFEQDLVSKYGDIRCRDVISNRIYYKTDNVFVKCQERAWDGRTRDWRTRPEPLCNEANALRLLATHTDIPIPKLLDSDYDKLGRFYVVTGLVHGVQLNQVKGNAGRDAVASVDAYITHHVLPKLKALTSNTTGLNGFVLPPPRLAEIFENQAWHPKTSAQPHFSFIHGDLGPQNILVDPSTLELLGIVDWEHAGYFPPVLEAEKWRHDAAWRTALFEDTARLEKEKALIT